MSENECGFICIHCGRRTPKLACVPIGLTMYRGQLREYSRLTPMYKCPCGRTWHRCYVEVTDPLASQFIQAALSENAQK
jgi:hypothetical protein